MNKIRLLPMLLVAITSLLILKSAGFWLHSPVISGGVTPAKAQTAETESAPESQNAEQPAAEAESQQAAEAGDENAEGGEPAQQTPPDEIGRLIKPGEAGLSETESAILGRLRERRQKLDQIERELTMRENLMAAAEKQLDERIKELKALEARISDAVDDQEEEQRAQLEGLVTMYETMKPKDAARIFNGLEMPILVEVSTQLKARKMAAILAEMDSEMAKELTVEIANRSRQAPFKGEQTMNENDLPKIGEDDPT